MASRKYRYESLNTERQQIRILKVHAASSSPTTTVNCTLSHVSLLDEPTLEYHTISYRWGNAQDRAYIIVDDRFLDIDAICINQQDPVERSQQVAMMAGIFSRTSSGYIWLGKEQESTSLAISGIKAIVDETRGECEDSRESDEALLDQQI
ncbi:hypothetical protein M409DRAFT_25209 [Zasmidium cellare ATCC 36951]|uniref:Heterokaryon incompatibility domain-containing protein n=1 Tax=Zasmidium cellare ATCC 36951 TaxID=1080233 RepID=A0A6A6CDN8_ZASCE|nr:uncharacterized protein M409DRAFT_25209 [Zasmidium cellare ATCC 36951]KAF2164330.1 hypothetical protein M409DRAFT_25209 [Zasmidium cellare ATCC 36951]